MEIAYVTGGLGLLRVWGICARTEGGVFMYRSKQPADRRPKTVMSQGVSWLK